MIGRYQNKGNYKGYHGSLKDKDKDKDKDKVKEDVISQPLPLAVPCARTGRVFYMLQNTKALYKSKRYIGS